jgi:hypothetical protein
MCSDKDTFLLMSRFHLRQVLFYHTFNHVLDEFPLCSYKQTCAFLFLFIV